MLHACVLSWTLIASNILALATSINFSYHILQSIKEEILNLKITLMAEEDAIKVWKRLEVIHVWDNTVSYLHWIFLCQLKKWYEQAMKTFL